MRSTLWCPNNVSYHLTCCLTLFACIIFSVAKRDAATYANKWCSFDISIMQRKSSMVTRTDVPNGVEFVSKRKWEKSLMTNYALTQNGRHDDVRDAMSHWLQWNMKRVSMNITMIIEKQKSITNLQTLF